VDLPLEHLLQTNLFDQAAGALEISGRERLLDCFEDKDG
jgi:hypothetical protein